MISAILGSPTLGQVSQLLNEAACKAGGCFDKKNRDGFHQTETSTDNFWKFVCFDRNSINACSYADLLGVYDQLNLIFENLIFGILWHFALNNCQFSSLIYRLKIVIKLCFSTAVSVDRGNPAQM